MKVLVHYPSKENEQKVMQLVRREQQQKYQQLTNVTPAAPEQPDALMLSQQEIAECWQAISAVHVSSTVENYIVNLVDLSRHPQSVSDTLAGYLTFGISPVAPALERCGRAQALAGRSGCGAARRH